LAAEEDLSGPGWLRATGQAASRGLRFTLGIVAGLLVLPFLGVLGLAGMYATATIGNWFAPPPPDRPWVEIRGRDVSASGGVSVVLKDESQALRLDCRDACDDLVETGGPAQHLEVRSASGECVVCREQPEASWWGTHPKTWLVKGSPLAVEESAS